MWRNTKQASFVVKSNLILLVVYMMLLLGMVGKAMGVYMMMVLG